MIRKSAARTTRQIDVSRFPEDIAALIDALQPAEKLIVTRDGQSIATISSSIEVVHGAIVDPVMPKQANDQPPIGDDSVTIVATAMKLSAAARIALSTHLGADYIVLDINKAPETADVLLAPPVSPQLIGILRSRFRNARVIITEFDDQDLCVDYQGPVRRMLNAGADAYLPVVSSIPRLARHLDHALTYGLQLRGGLATPLEIEAAAELPSCED